MKKVNVKPSKFMSFIGFIVGLIFCGIGIFVAIPNLEIFGIIWTIIVFLITIYNAVNLFTKKGISLYQITVDDKKDNDK